MVNAAAKGRRNERKAQKILEEQGYAVQLTQPGTRFQKDKDLFNLWDLIAVSEEEVRFIQVKSNRRVYGKEKRKYQDFVCPDFCTKEIWSIYDRKKEPVITTLDSHLVL